MTISNNIQFGRYIEVRVKNFVTGEITTIGNEFKIDFQFYKTIDQVNEASVGDIKIHGINIETFNRIAQVNNEVEFICGYSYGVIDTLFVANIVQVTPEISEGGIACTLKVSANFAELFFNNHTFSETETTIGLLLQKVAGELGEENAEFALDGWNIPREHSSSVIDYLTNRRITFFANGTTKDILQQICSTFYLTSNFNQKDNNTTLTFYILDGALSWYIEQSYKPYAKTVRTTGNILKLFEEDVEGRYGNVVTSLTSKTGMLGAPKEEIKIQKVPENWKLNGNEEITRKGEQTILDAKQREAEAQRKASDAAAKRAERERKAKEAGKTLKPLKPKIVKDKKPLMVQISRKYIRVEALLNPMVKPQSHVEVISTSPFFKYNGIYRVRNAKYSGNNKDGKMTMELYLEDSGNLHTSEATPEEIKLYGEQQGEQVDGELGGNGASNVVSEGNQDSVNSTGGE